MKPFQSPLCGLPSSVTVNQNGKIYLKLVLSSVDSKHIFSSLFEISEVERSVVCYQGEQSC